MKKIITCLVFIISLHVAKAQELESILLASDDASLLTQKYLNPAVKGLMFGLNSGWATTAKVHDKFGFDITIGANLAFVPSSEEMFAFVPSDYEYLSLPGGQTMLPTVMSKSGADTKVNVSVRESNGTYLVGSFNMPGGIAEDLPVSAVPAPHVQLGFGLPFKTDIKARFMPKLNFDDDVEAGLFGLGLQHDLTQYFGPLEKLPLNIAVLAAFTTLDATYNINDDDPDDSIAVSNGRTEFKVNTWTIQALASLDFKIATLYGGVGYNNGKSTVKTKGDYTLSYDIEDENGNYLGSTTQTIKDPINIDFDANGLRANIGARLNLSIFKIFADYTFQEYNTATLGIAFSVR